MQTQQWQASINHHYHPGDGHSSANCVPAAVSTVCSQQYQPQHVQQQQQPYVGNGIPSSTTSTASTQCHAVSENVTVAADDVGAAFAFQYFKIMKTRPEDLFRFYNNDSKISRGSPKQNGEVGFNRAFGISHIRDLLYKEHNCGAALGRAIISTVESQDGLAGGISLQITGTLNYVDDTTRSFVMSVFLVRQDGLCSSGYYILNDILIFQNPTRHFPQLSMEANFGETSSRVEPPPIITTTQTGLTLQQHQSLSQDVLNPVLAPIAPTAHPAAAPLPTTTAPQLSGGCLPSHLNSHTVNLVVKEDVLNMDVQSKIIDGSICSTIVSNETVEPIMTPIYTETAAAAAAAAAVTAPLILKNELDQVEDSTISNDSIVEKSDLSLVASHDLETIKTEPLIIESISSNKPKKTWKKNLSTTIVKDMDFSMETSLPLSEKIMEPVQLPSSIMMPSRVSPVNPTAYAKNSYAGVLLQSNSGSLRIPCQRGFSVPPPDQQHSTTAIIQEKASVRPQSVADTPIPHESGSDHDSKRKNRYGSTSNSAGKIKRNKDKTLWTSLLPTDMSDDLIKKAISDQLKGQTTEGHAVRIERIKGHVHGYIELDTELSTKILLEKGLHLQGRMITVAMPRTSTWIGNKNNMKVQHRSEQIDDGTTTTTTTTPPVSNIGGTGCDSSEMMVSSQRRPYRTIRRHENSLNNILPANGISEESEEGGGWVAASRRKLRKPVNTTTASAGNTFSGNKYTSRTKNSKSYNSGRTGPTTTTLIKPMVQAVN